MGQIAVGEDRGMCVKRHCKSYSPLQRIPPTSTVIDWSYGRTPADYDEKLILDGTLAFAIRLPFAIASSIPSSSVLTWNGKTAPSGFLHKQVDITSRPCPLMQEYLVTLPPICY